MSTDSPPSGFVHVGDLTELRTDGPLVVNANGTAIALFYHDDTVHAVDNRCPHMGFPLVRGSVEEGILTCHWHHARFELEAGDTFDIWADDVQTFPTHIADGDIFVDPDPEPDVPPTTHWRNRLADGLQENLSLVLAKAVIGLDEQGEGFETPLKTAVTFGTKYREQGWGRGLTTLSATANLYDHLGARDRRRAMFLGVREVASDAAGEPPRFQQYSLHNQDLEPDRLKSWFRRNCEVRDENGAERVLLTAIEALPKAAVAEILFAAATDHLYMNASHTLDFINSALETAEVLGWDEHAPAILASTVHQLTDATRSEELSAWRQPVDLADLVFDATDRLPELVETGSEKTWNRPDGFVESLLVDDPEAIIDTLTTAIEDGATQTQLADAVARAATRRVAYFATNNEFGDWDTVHHTLTYANAVHRATQKTDAVELYRGCFDGAMSIYLDRFLNSPKAPLPSLGESDSTRDPSDIRADLLDCFDEQGNVNRAARLVSEYFDVVEDLEVPDLKRTIGRGLLREDADFHTIQNVEDAFQRHAAVDEPEAKRMALMATARYLAAHTPTRRENEQTFSIATRLHQGERLHEAE